MAFNKDLLLESSLRRDLGENSRGFMELNVCWRLMYLVVFNMFTLFRHPVRRARCERRQLRPECVGRRRISAV